MPLRPCSLRPLLSVDDAGAARRVRGAAEAAALAVSVPIGGYSAARRSSFSAGRVAMTDRKIRPLPRSSIEAAALEQVRSVRMPVEFLSSFRPRHLVFCPFGWLFLATKKTVLVSAARFSHPPAGITIILGLKISLILLSLLDFSYL
jgi:hypothetical protein